MESPPQYGERSLLKSIPVEKILKMPRFRSEYDIKRKSVQHECVGNFLLMLIDINFVQNRVHMRPGRPGH
jgi:hypothetical protein